MYNWNETISGIITVQMLLEKSNLELGYVDYVNESEVQKWNLKEERVYTIPGYQREIRWTPQNVQTLLDDVKKGSKFLGNVLLSTSDNKQYEIIDGQQRITVIIMILEYMNTKSSNNVVFCPLKNYTYPSFWEELKINFDIDSISNEETRRRLINEDVLDQRDKLADIWNFICGYIDLLSKNEISDLKEHLLESAINLIITKVHSKVKSSRGLCVDYFIDINNKSEHLDAIDILRAYAFREDFDEAADLWIQIRKNEKNDEIINYPTESMFLHYILCSCNEILDYKVRKISDDFRLLSEVTLKNGKTYLKGTDIEVLIEERGYYLKMLNRLIAFQKFMQVTIDSKTSPDTKFEEYFSMSEGKLDFDTIKNAFDIITDILRNSDVVPKILVMKYFLDVLQNEASTKEDYKLIYPINVLCTCFSAGNSNSKGRAKFSTIVLKEKWKESLNRSAGLTMKNFPQKVLFGREVQYMGKATKTSGEYLAKRVARVARSYSRQGDSIKINEKEFGKFLGSTEYNGEHFLINKSLRVSFKYKTKDLFYEYNNRLKGKISYLANYLIIKEDINKVLKNGTVREKIDIIEQYKIEEPNIIIFADAISENHYKLIRQCFVKCPSADDINSCQSIEEAKKRIQRYYDEVFEEEFKTYLELIQDEKALFE